MIFRNLCYHWRINACVALGAALATAILVGALGTGDSVRGTLRKQVRQRLGRIDAALTAGERTVRAALAADIARATARDVAAVFQAGGSVERLPVQVLGVDHGFWALSAVPAAPAALRAEEAAINRRLANQLGVREGDSILVRVEQPSRLPRELSLSSVRIPTVGLRVTVREIVDEGHFGDFRLRQEATPVHNVFLSRGWLVDELELDDHANLLLAGAPPAGAPPTKDLEEALRVAWTAEDAALRFERRTREPGGAVLTSDRVFLAPHVADVVMELKPGAQPVVSYLVNEIRHKARGIPYSFAAAPGASLLPEAPGPNQVWLNAWAADDLEAGVGEPIALTYYVTGPLRTLVERTNAFEVAGIVPMDSPACDPSLVPELPGISDAETCADWDPGLPVELDRIRPEDEAYWETYRGTPKVFLSLAAATNLWQNRHGAYTAIRFEETNAAALARQVMDGLDPAALGLNFEPVQAMAARTGGGSVDFGQLFLALSFFILFSALLLTGLLFVFSVQSRSAEIGTLLFLGWEKRSVVWLLIGEGALIALAGSAVGVLLGLGYQRGVLTALATIWQGAVASTEIETVLRGRSLAIGWAAGMLVSLGVMGVALRQATQRDGLRLVSGGMPGGRRWPGVVVAAVCGGAALAILLGADADRGQRVAALFFGAGSLLLVAFLGAFSCWVMAPRPSLSHGSLTGRGLMLRGFRLRRGRSIASVILLAAGVFVVVAVGANRHAVALDPRDRGSGTGGFAFFMTTAVPVVHDLSTVRGRREAGLSRDAAPSLDLVPMRLLEGDDASCLNLNQVIQPRVLGVDPASLDRRGAFTFARWAEGVDAEHPWRALETPIDARTLPAVADQTVITWSLNKRIGDLVEIQTGTGQTLNLKLVGGLRNSILQGYVMVSERLLLEQVPGLTGTRVFLVDAAESERDAAADALRSTFQGHGTSLVPAVQRLAQFSVVQDTYLGIFLMLGGFGVVLGTGGVGLVLLRNVLERRRELGILRAVGFTRRALFMTVLGEHALILAGGIACGVPPALIAVLPSMVTAGRSIPWGLLAVIVGLVVASALAWIAAATTLALRGHVLHALREE